MSALSLESAESVCVYVNAGSSGYDMGLYAVSAMSTESILVCWKCTYEIVRKVVSAMPAVSALSEWVC